MMDAPDPFAPARLGPVTLRNRIVKAATFEGMTPEHVVSDRLIEFHRKVAAGGVGMTTIAYCAVSPDGCGAPNEMILAPAPSRRPCAPRGARAASPGHRLRHWSRSYSRPAQSPGTPPGSSAPRA
jgi:hypothetical protein